MVNAIEQCGLMLLIFIIAELSYSVKSEKIFPEKRIKEIAERDLTRIGYYDGHMEHSLRIRLTFIWQRIAMYNNLDATSVSTLFEHWVSDYCFDPEKRISDVVHHVNIDLSLAYKDLDKFRETFHPELELPEPPRSLVYNDYLNVDKLDSLYYETINEYKEVVR